MGRKLLLLVTTMLVVSAGALEAQNRRITGRVTAEGGPPIREAMVEVVGTALRTFTGPEGTFVLNVPTGTVTLRASVLGYRTTTATLAPADNTIEIVVGLDPLSLDEVVVTGTATTIAKRNAANAVATVNAADLTRAPAQTMERALQGKVAGAYIQSNSGAPGGGLQVNLRGVSSINAAAEPLYVIDGVIMSNAAVPGGMHELTESSSDPESGAEQDNAVNRIADLNPEDIERIEILKGASASAIYGSKASNGVVIITTKRGRPGETRFSLTQRFGTYDLARKLGSRTYDTLEEAVSVWGPSAANFYQQGRVFDHEEQLAGRNDLSTETALSVTGGSEGTRYFASGLIKSDAGIIEGSGYDKQSLRLNLDQALGERVDFQISTNITHSLARRALSNNDNTGTSFWMVFPFTPNFVDLSRQADGSYPDNPFYVSNPLETAALLDNDENVWRFTTAGTARYHALSTATQSLEVVATGGVDYFEQKNEMYAPPDLQFEPLDGLPGTSILSNADNVNANGTANLVHTYRPGSLQATTSFGVQYEVRDLNFARVTSKNLLAGQTRIDAGTVFDLYELRQRTEDLGIFLQEEVLLLDERLLVTAGARADRSSNNGDPAEWFLYPKAAASYRFPDLLGAGDELKIRAAYGESGNQPLFGQKFTPLLANQNIEGIAGLTVDITAGDPNIEPERQKEIEAGVDLRLFDSRVSLEVTGYQQDISNLLLQRQLHPSSGFTFQVFNGGELRVRGIEVGLGATPVASDNVTWLFRSTFSANRSEVTDLPVPAFTTGGFGNNLGAFKIEEGKSATQIVGTVDGEVVPLGDSNPDFRMAFMNDLSWGPLNVYGLLDWQKGSDLINLTKLLYDFAANTWDYEEAGADRVSGFGSKTGNWIEDGSFVKLREVALAYQLPETLYAGLWSRISGARLTLTGRDLYTWSDYSGFDPEVSNFGSQQIARNIDVAPYPPSRSVWFGINVTF